MRIMIGAVVALALAVSAGAAQAQVYDKWNIGAFLVEGTDNGCRMTASADTSPEPRLPVYLTISIDRQNGLRAVVHSSDWVRLETEREYPIEIVFLGTETIHDVTAVGVGFRGDNGLMFAPDEDWIEDFRTATGVVFLRGEVVLARFDVKGAHPAFRTLETCFIERVAEIEGETERARRNPRDPFG
jgi:hypothetical protein